MKTNEDAPTDSVSSISLLASTCGISFKEAQYSLQILANAAKKVEFPPFAKIRKIRLSAMRETYGIARFFLPEYWRWKFAG